MLTSEQKAEILAVLVKNAIDCTTYVVFGRCMVEELSKKMDLPKADVQSALYDISQKIADRLRGMNVDE